MEGIGFLSGLGRSNILKYNSSKKGVGGTLYIDYDNNIGYIWNQDDNNYIEVFNSATTKGLNFRGLYEDYVDTDTKQDGDFWITYNGIWKIWDGTKFVDYDDINTSYDIYELNESKTLTLFNCIYLVDTSNSNIEITIPISSENNKGDYVKFIKSSNDNNTVLIKTERDLKETYLNNINDYIEFVSTGNETYDWIISDYNIIGSPIKYVEFKGSDSNLQKADNNWKIVTDESNLLIQRYENNETKTMTKIGQNITSDNFNISKASGKLTFTNSNGIKKTLISPSRDINGTVVGNKDGRVSLINNGQLVNVNFSNIENTVVVNSSSNESKYGNEFSYHFITTSIKDFKSGTISILNAPLNTRVRFSILDTNYNILAENVSEFDFNSSSILGGELVSNGSNTIEIEQDLIFPSSYEFILKLNFSNPVTLNGGTINLNDGFGTRFVPTLSLIYYEGTATEVVHSGNIKDVIGLLEDDNRIDSKSIGDNIFISSNDLTLTKDHINHTIVLTHTSGIVSCIVEDSTIFYQGDKITIHPKYSEAKFIDNTNGTNIDIKTNDTIILQKGHDNTWCIISRFISEGYGNKLYYFPSSINTITGESIKNNISEYPYTTDWNIGDNNFDINVESVGAYYIYFVLPTDFTIDGYKYVETCVLNGISYDIFVSLNTISFTNLSQIITAGVYTDVLGYNDGVPTDGEILIGDGTRLGIAGGGLNVSDIATNDYVNTELSNKVNTNDILTGSCFAMKTVIASQILSNVDTLVLFEQSSDLSYNESYVGLTYSNGIFTNNKSETIVLSITYQMIWGDLLKSDRTLWVKNDNETMNLDVSYGAINMALESGKSIEFYVNNATVDPIALASNIQIINMSPIK